MALKANAAGDYFPVFGICLGFELMSMSVADNSSILVSIKTGTDNPKNLYPLVEKNESKMFYHMEHDLYYDGIRNKKLAYFHHSFTVDPKAWESNKHLAGNFTVTSVTNDTEKTTYAATVEGKNIPFFGVQFHPEKDTFEWPTSQDLPHNADATNFQQHWANFFVNHTKLNNHTMTSELFMELNIHRFLPWHISDDPEFERLYLFENYKLSQELINVISSKVPWVPAIAFGRTPTHSGLYITNTANTTNMTNVTTTVNSTSTKTTETAVATTTTKTLKPTFLSIKDVEDCENDEGDYEFAGGSLKRVTKFQLRKEVNRENGENVNIEDGKEDIRSWLFFA